MLGLKISREHGLELIVFHCSKGGGSSSTSNSLQNNSYAKPMLGKCLNCGKPGHKSNECHGKVLNLAKVGVDESEPI